jgi:uncharacterized repeat protein (TIGR04076 family)
MKESRIRMSIVEVTVMSQKGKCAFGHKVGDKIIFDGRSVKGDICYSALTVLLPKVFAMRYDASFPWAQDKDIILNACPDGESPVVFEIRRLKRKVVAKQSRKGH